MYIYAYILNLNQYHYSRTPLLMSPLGPKKWPKLADGLNRGNKITEFKKEIEKSGNLFLTLTDECS